MPGQGYVLTNRITHARLVPKESKHVFSYPTLSFLLPLAALENGKLDLAVGRLFGYGGPFGRVTSIRPSAFLRDDYFEKNATRKGRIRDKLEDVLARYGHDPNRLSDAWMLAMPAYLGFEGINPLTVYYCLNLKEELWVVVLEVHNTFGERHIYVLPVDSDANDEDISSGFTHSWSFAKQFHVSPFSDRSGFYKCSIVAPRLPPPPLPAKTNRNSSPVTSLPTVQIHLYTGHPSNSELKLTATLRPTLALPLTSHNLLSSLFKYPFVLLQSFPRIAFEAYRLHYGKRLDVYIRPEPRSVDPAFEERFSQTKRNAVQRNNNSLGIGGGVGWQGEGVLEGYARRVTEAYLSRRARELDVEVVLKSSDLGYGVRCFGSKSTKRLEVAFRSSRFFMILLTVPSAYLALLLAKAEDLVAVSDDMAFLEIFSLPSNSFPKGSPTSVSRFSQTLRLLSVPVTFRDTAPRYHPFDTTVKRTLLNIFVTILTVLISWLEKHIFSFIRARVVPGDEPWLAWERAKTEHIRCSKLG